MAFFDQPGGGLPPGGSGGGGGSGCDISCATGRVWCRDWYGKYGPTHDSLIYLESGWQYDFWLWAAPYTLPFLSGEKTWIGELTAEVVGAGFPATSVRVLQAGYDDRGLIVEGVRILYGKPDRAVQHVYEAMTRAIDKNVCLPLVSMVTGCYEVTQFRVNACWTGATPPPGGGQPQPVSRGTAGGGFNLGGFLNDPNNLPVVVGGLLVLIAVNR